MNIFKTDFFFRETSSSPTAQPWDSSVTEVYVTGCDNNCEGCHNAALQDKELGIYWEDFLEKYKPSFGKTVWIMGGEPLYQDIDDMRAFIRYLKDKGCSVWIWTGYNLEDIEVFESFMLFGKMVDMWKIGSYQKDLPSIKIDDIELSSNNQKIMNESQLYSFYYKHPYYGRLIHS